MAWFTSDAGLCGMGGQNTSTSLLTTVTASATANTVGSWVQLFASPPFHVHGIRLHLGKTGIAVAVSNTQTLLNVGTGSTPTAIVSNVAIGGCLAFTTIYFPIFVPLGTPIAAQIQSQVGSKSTTMGVQIFGGGTGLEVGYKATTYGAVSSGASRGTILAAPASANTVEGAWTQLSASTTSPMRWMVVGLAAPDTSTATAADHLVDIGVGAASAEAAVVTDIACSISANEEIACPRSLTFPVNIPAGSRLVARYRGTSTLTSASPNVTVTGIS